MVEIVSVGGLSAVATWALVRAAGLSGPTAVLLGPVVGLAGYVGVVTLIVTSVGSAHPAVAVAATVVVFLAVGARSTGGSSLRQGAMIAVLAFVVVCGGGLVAAALDATRLTPDSLSYIAVADILTEPDAVGRLRPYTIEARNVSTGALHTVGQLAGRPYAEVATPVLTGSGILAMLWLLDRHLVGRRLGRTVIVTTAVFCLTAGRPLYDAFFVNAHGPVMAWLFALVAAGYLLVREDSRGWALVAAAVAPAILVARPEGPILVALGMLPVLTDRSGAFERRWLLAVPSAIVGVAWFAAAAAVHPGLLGFSPSQPVLPAIATVLGLVVVGLLRSRGLLLRWNALLPWALAAALAAVFVVGTLDDPERTATSIEATAVNLTAAGGWGLTWLAMISLMVVAVSAPPAPHARLLLPPILGFGALFWASIVLRDNPYRIGTGDSGNRMLAHIFLVVVFYVVLTIAAQVRSPAEPGSPSPEPARLE